MRAAAGFAVVVFLLIVCLPLAAPAQEEGSFDDRLQVSLAGFWPKLNTSIRLDARDGSLGTNLDLEDDLGLDDRKATPLFSVDWRIKGPHHLQFHWFDLDRSSSKRLEGEIRIEDEIFYADETLESSLDTRVLVLNYGYDFFHKKENASLGILGGFHYVDLSAKFNVLDREVSESASADAPLPLIGIFGGHAFNDKWGFWGSGQLFALSIDDYDGTLVNLWAQIYHNPFKHFGWGFGYNWFGFNLDVTDSDLNGNLDFAYQGPMIFVKYRLP
jgi:hypothetical protein